MLTRFVLIIVAWLSLVERCVRDAEVASSNLVASIPACWSSGQDDALSRRKPGFDSRTGHDLNRLSEIQIAGFLFPVSCGAGPPPKSLASPPLLFIKDPGHKMGCHRSRKKARSTLHPILYVPPARRKIPAGGSIFSFTRGSYSTSSSLTSSSYSAESRSSSKASATISYSSSLSMFSRSGFPLISST